jgi:hypothetical protein
VAVSVYVDNARNRFGRMIMCHMWADNEEELHAFAARLGLKRAWFQQPAKASWKHYDVSLGTRAKAITLGAIETDKYGPSEFVAKQRGNTQMLDRIAACRARGFGR